jgi:hypothetical protein
MSAMDKPSFIKHNKAICIYYDWVCILPAKFWANLKKPAIWAEKTA